MSVIFSRAPLRISLGGGGTDLPSYYREHGGFLVAGAIDKYVYMLVHTVFQRRYRMKYSEIEEVDDVCGDPPPDPARDAASSLAGKPARDRLCRRRACRHGNGIFRCLHGLSAQGPRPRPAHLDHTRGLAEAACEIEIDVLGEPVGKQDQYVAAHGGICAYTFHRDGSVDVEPLELTQACSALARAPAALLHRRGAVGVGCPRRPGRIARRLAIRTCSRTCTAPRSSGYEAASCSGRRPRAYAELMHEHWETSDGARPEWRTSASISSTMLARRSGAIGGKLVGAGGGGFLLVYSPPA